MSAKPKLTSQQSAAIFTQDVSVALSAGAGCGKTFVLTQRFLSYLQPAAGSDNLHSIVAITFTERAAREMRDRIREACRIELQGCADADVDHWLQVIRGLDSARISTIHSFCGTLLRSHAVDAGIDPRFGQLEAAAADTLLRNEVRRVVRGLMAKQDEDCLELVVELGLERTESLLRSLIYQRFPIDFDQFADHDPQSLTAEWIRRWHEESVPQLLRNLAEGEAARRVVTLLEENEPSHAEMQRRRETLLRQLDNLIDTSDPQTVLAELAGAAKVQGGGGKSVWSDEDVYERVKNSLGDLRKGIKKAGDALNVDFGDVATAARLALIAARLTKIAGDRYDAAKHELGVLDFDDLLLQSRNLLRASETVRARAASSIQFLMVDEFQDTDPVQADIVRMLCGERLLNGKLFLVGDAKQSIYRFRRADPAVFHQLRGEIPQTGRLPLNTNFRSQPEILKFVNCLFTGPMGDIYEPLTPFADTQLSPTPTIEFLFPTIDAQQDEDTSASGKRRKEAAWIAGRIAELLHDGVPRIRDKNPETGAYELRPVRLGDFAILFRALGDVELYEDALRKQGLEYYLIGGRAFYAQQEIFDLVNLYQYLDDPDDQISLAGVLRSPLFSLTDDALFSLTMNSQTLDEGLRLPPAEFLPYDQQRQIAYATQVLAELQRKKDRIPIAELLQLALERTGYDASLLNEFLGSRKLANLRKLIDMARQFDRTGLFTLKDFVIRMRESVSEEVREELAATHPETSNVIRLMTIHQSKGLEFPIVIVADMDRNSGGVRSEAVFHPELGPLIPLASQFGQTRSNLGREMHKLQEETEEAAESLRVLYVATTRPSDYLILSACLPETGKLTSQWMKLMAYCFDLSTGLPAVDPYLGRLSLGNVSPDDIPAIFVHRQAPGIPKAAKPRTSAQVPMQDFMDTVEDAAAGPLPPFFVPFAGDQPVATAFSPSTIEDIDARLLGLEHDGATFEGGPPVVGESDSASGRESFAESEILGTLVHDSLEWVDFKQPEHLLTVFESCLNRSSKTITPRLRERAWKWLAEFQASELWQELAEAPKCYRELEFRLQRQPLDPAREPYVLTGLIDCVYQNAQGEWCIIDYKTGIYPQAKSPEDIVGKYAVQLGIYAVAVERLLERMPDRIGLVILRNGIEHVPMDLTQGTLAAVMQRVDNAVDSVRQASIAVSG